MVRCTSPQHCCLNCLRLAHYLGGPEEQWAREVYRDTRKVADGQVATTGALPASSDGVSGFLSSVLPRSLRRAGSSMKRNTSSDAAVTRANTPTIPAKLVCVSCPVLPKKY